MTSRASCASYSALVKVRVGLGLGLGLGLRLMFGFRVRVRVSLRERRAVGVDYARCGDELDELLQIQ